MPLGRPTQQATAPRAPFRRAMVRHPMTLGPTAPRATALRPMRLRPLTPRATARRVPAPLATNRRVPATWRTTVLRATAGRVTPIQRATAQGAPALPATNRRVTTTQRAPTRPVDGSTRPSPATAHPPPL